MACSTLFADAQIAGASERTVSAKAAKPYKILTSGKQVTVKSHRTIVSIMVWTSNGHRVIEQKDVNSNTYNFSISISAKVFFVMIKLDNGQVYTEKIGV